MVAIITLLYWMLRGMAAAFAMVLIVLMWLPAFALFLVGMALMSLVHWLADFALRGVR